MRPTSRVVLRAQPQSGWKLSTWTGACRGAAPTCSLHVKAATRVGVRFIAPGTQANPVPLGTAASIDFGHTGTSLKVASVTPNAMSQVLAVDPKAAPPPEMRDVLIRLSVTA